MPVLKWVDDKRMHYNMRAKLANDINVAYSTRPSPKTYLIRTSDEILIEGFVIGRLQQRPETDELLMEKMEELVSKFYPEEYLKAMLEQTEAGG